MHNYIGNTFLIDMLCEFLAHLCISKVIAFLFSGFLNCLKLKFLYCKIWKQ